MEVDLENVLDALGLDTEGRASAVARGVIRNFIQHPEVYGWHDPVAHEALRVAQLALLISEKQSNEQ